MHYHQLRNDEYDGYINGVRVTWDGAAINKLTRTPAQRGIGQEFAKVTAEHFLYLAAVRRNRPTAIIIGPIHNFSIDPKTKKPVPHEDHITGRLKDHRGRVREAIHVYVGLQGDSLHAETETVVPAYRTLKAKAKARAKAKPRVLITVKLVTHRIGSRIVDADDDEPDLPDTTVEMRVDPSKGPWGQMFRSFEPSAPIVEEPEGETIVALDPISGIWYSRTISAKEVALREEKIRERRRARAEKEARMRAEEMARVEAERKAIKEAEEKAREIAEWEARKKARMERDEARAKAKEEARALARLNKAQPKPKSQRVDHQPHTKAALKRNTPDAASQIPKTSRQAWGLSFSSKADKTAIKASLSAMRASNLTVGLAPRGGEVVVEAVGSTMIFATETLESLGAGAVTPGSEAATPVAAKTRKKAKNARLKAQPKAFQASILQTQKGGLPIATLKTGGVASPSASVQLPTSTPPQMSRSPNLGAPHQTSRKAKKPRPKAARPSAEPAFSQPTVTGRSVQAKAKEVGPQKNWGQFFQTKEPRMPASKPAGQRLTDQAKAGVAAGAITLAKMKRRAGGSATWDVQGRVSDAWGARSATTTAPFSSLAVQRGISTLRLLLT